MNKTIEQRLQELLTPDPEDFQSLKASPWEYYAAATASIDRLHMRRWLVNACFGIPNLMLMAQPLFMDISYRANNDKLFLLCVLGILTCLAWLPVNRHQLYAMDARLTMLGWIESDLKFRPVVTEQAIAEASGDIGSQRMAGVSRTETWIPVFLLVIWICGAIVVATSF